MSRIFISLTRVYIEYVLMCSSLGKLSFQNMGNSGSSSKVRHKSESMEIKYTKPKEKIGKSKSMMELGSRGQQKRSISSIKEKERPKLALRDSRNGSTTSVITRQKSMRRDISHPINPQGREIITQCFENPHSEFGNKVLQRIFEKRSDYQKYVYALGKEKAYQMSIRLKELVEEVVLKIYDPDYISSISRVYGEEHVELKTFGFKPDFWVAIADAITIEGVILDMANHQPADTVAAWSQLVTMMFSAVRDGYYTALRKHRMSSRRCLRRQTTVDSEKDTTNSTPDVNLSVPELQSVQQTTRPIKSTSMSSVESEGNDSSKKYAGSINIMAPVENPRCTVAASNGRTGGSFRAIGVVGNANSVTTVNCRPRPIFE